MKPLFAIVILAFLVMVAVPTVGGGQSPAKPASTVTDAEYEVFSAYINSEFTGDRGKDRVGHRVLRIVIADKTQSDMDDDELRDDDGKQIAWKKISGLLHKQATRLQASTLDSFRRNSTVQVNFGRSFHLPVAYELVDKADFDAIFTKGGWWTGFYKKYPKSQGFLTLSRAGFSPDGKQALFYASNGCGGKCGTGTYVVMERTDSGWKILKEILLWIS